MGRKPRVEYQGGLYHIIQRGNNREYIFKKDEDKAHLMKLVKEYKGVLGYEIYGFVVMDNHYHIVIRTLDAPLQNIMHRINNQFSKHYNRKNSRTGHVFENRYKGILVKDDKYLLSLLRYVHQNPVQAKICKRVRDYKWSSDTYYRKNIEGKIVDIDFVLDIFSENRKEAIRLYKSFMEDEGREGASFFEEGQYIEEKKDRSISHSIKGSQVSSKKGLDEILLEVSEDKDIFEDIKAGSRKRSLSQYKKEYIKRALASNYTMKEIGENISVSEVAIFKINSK